MAKAKKLKVMYAVSEALPFIATGGLGEVGGSLPAALEKDKRLDVRVIMPLYRDIAESVREKAKFVCSFEVPLSWRSEYCGVFSLKKNGVIFYFIDNEYYFKRPGLYGFYDDGERFSFFCRAVFECLEHIGFIPDIVHCNDWQTGLIPVYMRYEPRYPAAKTIFTIHNIEYQGKFDLSIISEVFGLPAEAGATLEYEGCANIMKGALESAHLVSTVSPSYAAELNYAFYAHGLEKIMQRNSFKMRAVLNGIDTKAYDPQKDPYIKEKYSAETLPSKKANKAALQRLTGLPEDTDIFLLAVISRLVAHKGLDLVRYVADEMLSKDIQLVVLGKGDCEFENFFRELAGRYPEKCSAIIEFNKELARKVYAGADAFLMPSKCEPCGLSQMIACRYGTVPIVRATGGLKDSVSDCGFGKGNGFVFENYNAHDMLEAVCRAEKLYSERRNDWDRLAGHAMSLDFSWERSAEEYILMYSELSKNR